MAVLELGVGGFFLDILKGLKVLTGTAMQWKTFLLGPLHTLRFLAALHLGKGSDANGRE